MDALPEIERLDKQIARVEESILALSCPQAGDALIRAQYPILIATNLLLGDSARHRLLCKSYISPSSNCRRGPVTGMKGVAQPPSARVLSSIAAHLRRQQQRQRRRKLAAVAVAAAPPSATRSVTSKAKRKRADYDDTLDREILISTRAANDPAISNARNVERELRAIRARPPTPGGRAYVPPFPLSKPLLLPLLDGGSVRMPCPAAHLTLERTTNPWTASEKLTALRAMATHGKDFQAVANALTFKDVHDVVRFYYTHKRLLRLSEVVAPSPGAATGAGVWFRRPRKKARHSHTHIVDDADLVVRAYSPLPSYSLLTHEATDDEEGTEERDGELEVEIEQRNGADLQDVYRFERSFQRGRKNAFEWDVDLEMYSGFDDVSAVKQEPHWEQQQEDPWLEGGRQMMVIFNPLPPPAPRQNHTHIGLPQGSPHRQHLLDSTGPPSPSSPPSPLKPCDHRVRSPCAPRDACCPAPGPLLHR